MNNSINQKNASNKPEVSIRNSFESFYLEDQNKTAITLHIPVKFYVGGKKTESEISELIKEEVRLNISSISDYMAGESYSMMMEHYDNKGYVMEIAAFFILLNSYVKGYTTLLEEVEMYLDETKNTGEAQASQPKSPLDLSEVCTEFLKTNEMNCSTEEKKSQNLTDHTLQIWAEKLSCILASDETEAATRHAIEDIILSASDEANIHIFEPEIVRYFFPQIIKSLNLDYGRGILHSLQSIVEGLPEHQRAALKQFERRFESRPAGQPKNIVGDLNSLARQISAIMCNPLLPESLYKKLSDEMSGIGVDIHTPENVLHNLELLREDQ